MVVAFSTAAVECARKTSADMTQVLLTTFVDIWNNKNLGSTWGGGGGGGPKLCSPWGGGGGGVQKF